jgi:hypothetical protein
LRLDDFWTHCSSGLSHLNKPLGLRASMLTAHDFNLNVDLSLALGRFCITLAPILFFSLCFDPVSLFKLLKLLRGRIVHTPAIDNDAAADSHFFTFLSFCKGSKR